MNRKERIIQEIKKSDKPISASSLAKICHVSRQIIVGDIALLRASGIHIIATPRGYVLDYHQGLSKTIAFKHTQEQMDDELYTIVDLGGEIIDVIVEHPIYGQITGKLHLKSRYDVDQFLKKVKSSTAKPLSQLTDGIHLHTIQYPDANTLQRIEEALLQKGYLFKGL